MDSDFHLIPHWLARRKNATPEPDSLSTLVSGTGCYLSFELESAVCDALGVVWDSPAGMPGSGFHASLLKSVNIFRDKVTVQCFSNPKDLLGWAEGLALGGGRIALWLDLGQFGKCIPQLMECAEKNLPINIHLFRSFDKGADDPETHRQLEMLADSGSQIWLCASNSDLIWQSLAGRKISENLKIPNFVFHNSPHHFWVPQEIQFPRREDLISFFKTDGKAPNKSFDLSRPMLCGSRFSAEIEPLNLFSKKTLIWDKYNDVCRTSLKNFEQTVGLSPGPHFTNPPPLKGNILVVLENGHHLGLETTLEYLSKKLKKKIDVLRYNQPSKNAHKFPRGLTSKCEHCYILGLSRDSMLNISGELQSLAINHPAFVFVQFTSSQNGISESKWSEILKTKPSPGIQFLQLENEISFPETQFPKRQAHYDAIKRDLGLKPNQDVPQKTPLSLPYKNTGVIFPAEDYAFPLMESLLKTLGIKARRSLKFECIPLNAKANILSIRRDGGFPEYRVSESRYNLMILKLADAFFGFDPFAKLEAGGKVVFVEGEKPSQLKYKLPRHWRGKLKDLNAQCYCVSTPDFFKNSEQIFSGNLPGECRPVPVDSLSYQHRDEFEPFSALRRWKKLKDANRDTSSFWGSWIEPYQAGENIFHTPEIHAATSEVPPSTSAFHNTWIQRNRMPKFIPENCNGCSHCWTVCPDNAFSAKAFEVSELIFSLANREPATNIPGKLKRYVKLFPPLLKDLASKEDSHRISMQSFSGALSALLGEVPETDRPELENIFANIAGKFQKLQPINWKALTEGTSWSPSAEPVLLNLEINPHMCKGCGVCVSVCQPGALEVVGDLSHDVEADAEVWKFHDELPYTSNKIIGAVGESELPDLAGIMLSPYANFSMVGGTYSEPGSGEMLALRRLCCIAEYFFQSQTTPYIQKLESLQSELGEAIQNLIGQSFNMDVQQALGDVTGFPSQTGQKQISLEDLSHKLSANGKGPTIQSEKFLKLSRSLSEVNRQLWSFKEGPNGLGKSRFGMLITSERLSHTLAKFPYNPFSFPVVSSINHPEAAIGLQSGLLKEWTDLEKSIQKANLYLEWPSEIKVREAALEKTHWRELPENSLAIAPKILVIGDENLPDEIPEYGGLPVKFLALYSNPFRFWKNGWHSNPIKHMQSTSLFHADLFIRAGLKFLETPTSSLLSIYCPNPNLHGFPSEALMEHSESCYQSWLWPHFEKDARGEIKWNGPGDAAQDLTWEAFLKEAVAFCRNESRFQFFVRETGNPPHAGGEPPEIHHDLLLELQNVYLSRQNLMSASSRGPAKEKVTPVQPAQSPNGNPNPPLPGPTADNRAETLRQLKHNLLKIAGYRI